MELLCFPVTPYRILFEFFISLLWFFVTKTHTPMGWSQTKPGKPARLGCGELCDSFDSLRADFLGISGAGEVGKVDRSFHPLEKPSIFV